MVRPTNNSMQTAPVHQPVLSDEEDPHRSDVPQASGNVSANLPANPQPPVPANAGISPEMATFIAQTVQTAMATERERLAVLANACVTPSSGDPPSPAVVSTSGGVPASLNSSATGFLAAGGCAGEQPGQGRPSQ